MNSGFKSSKKRLVKRIEETRTSGKIITRHYDKRITDALRVRRKDESKSRALVINSFCANKAKQFINAFSWRVWDHRLALPYLPPSSATRL